MISKVDFGSQHIYENGMPSELLITEVRQALWPSQKRKEVPGYIRIDGLFAFFESHEMTNFGTVQYSESLPHSTVFLNALIKFAYERHSGHDTIVGSVVFNGLDKVSDRVPPDQLFKEVGGAKKYHLGTRIGVEQNVESLAAMALAMGINFDTKIFLENCIRANEYHSTKAPHFDADTKVGCLQKVCSDISGGDTVISDVGRFCNSNGYKLWDVIAPYLPDPESIYAQGCPRNILPYNTFVVRDEFHEGLTKYSTTVTDGPDQIVVFNNGWNMTDGQFFGFTHGATEPVKTGKKPSRLMTLSFATEKRTFEEIRRLREKVKI